MVYLPDMRVYVTEHNCSFTKPSITVNVIVVWTRAPANRAVNSPNKLVDRVTNFNDLLNFEFRLLFESPVKERIICYLQENKMFCCIIIPADCRNIKYIKMFGHKRSRGR